MGKIKEFRIKRFTHRVLKLSSFERQLDRDE